MSSFVFVMSLFLIAFCFFLSLSRLLNCLIVVENLNILLLFYCLMNQVSESRILFLILMVVFTIEVTVGLVVLSRLWDLSRLIDLVGR